MPIISSSISPKEIRYIKLGEGGKWEKSCIEDNIIRLGYESDLHEQCLKREWEVVKECWCEYRKDIGAGTRDVNQIRDFYELGEDDVWFTFYGGKLFWCMALKEVIELEDKSRIRKVKGKWSSSDKDGRGELRIENLDGRVSKVQAFRGTICKLEDKDVENYLIKKINGETIQDVIKAKEILQSLESAVAELIKGLWWKDFELLVDLIFTRSGWQRFSVLGKTVKDIDLAVYSPTNQKKAFVQIKSETVFSEINEYIRIYEEKYKQFDEMYFIFHSGPPSEKIQHKENIHIWGGEQLAKLVVNLGLAEWLINKRS